MLNYILTENSILQKLVPYRILTTDFYGNAMDWLLY